MKTFLTGGCLCLMLAAAPVLAQDEMAEDDQQLMVDPAFSDDPDAVVPAELQHRCDSTRETRMSKPSWRRLASTLPRSFWPCCKVQGGW